jgi:hypothetical protein
MSVSSSSGTGTGEELVMRSPRIKWDIWDLALMAGMVILAVATFMYLG